MRTIPVISPSLATILMSATMLAGVAVAALGCSAASDGGDDEPSTAAEENAVTSSVIKHVFVIPMENKSSSAIYGNKTYAPYINGTLLPSYAHATAFGDELPSLDSEPHYIFMEAGTNVFSDHSFLTDSLPSASNSTSSTSHLVTQIKNATNGVTWMSYQESIDATTGACPIAGNSLYAPRHNPFVFFKDVSGATPSKTNAYCAAHHKPLSSLAADLANDTVASFAFVTPNLCHDMHGTTACPQGKDANLNIKAGDDWLKANLPAMISYAAAHSGVIFVTWDEGGASGLIPFLAIGPNVKKGYAGAVKYDHGSLLKSVERVLAVPVLPKASTKNDLSDLFVAGSFP